MNTAPGRMRRLIADTSCDADGMRQDLRKQGIGVFIPGTRACKPRHDKRQDRDRWRVEAVFCRLKDFQRVATCCDELVRDFASALALAAVIAFRC